MENRIINMATVEEVARALKELKEQIVFVGGAVVSIYTDDPAADEIRPTKDIDLTLNVHNMGHWASLQEQLLELGFYPDPHGQSICSYKYKNIPVDIMSTKDGPLGPSNILPLGAVKTGELEVEYYEEDPKLNFVYRID